MKEYVKWEDVPDHLKTKTQLGEMGLKPGVGQKPVAIKVSKWRRTIKRYSLYDMTAASTKHRRAPLSEAHKAALVASRRTCASCLQQFSYVIGKGKICYLCANKQRKQRACQQAHKVMMARPVFLDVETTGLDERAEIVELAIVDLAGQVVMHTLVKPTVPMGEQVMAIHGISNEMVAEAPTFAEIWGELSVILRSNKVCAYTLQDNNFDLRLIRQSAAAVGITEAIEVDAVGVMDIFNEWYGEWSNKYQEYKWQSLSTATGCLKIELTDAHRALADAAATRLVVMKLAEHNEPTNHGSS